MRLVALRCAVLIALAVGAVAFITLMHYILVITGAIALVTG